MMPAKRTKLIKKFPLKNKIAVVMTILLVAAAGTYFISQSHAASADSIVFKTTQNYCYRLPAIVSDSSATLYAFAERRKASCSDNGDFDISMKTKAVNGTWSSEKIIVNRSTDRASNPVPIIKNGVIYLIYSYKDNKVGRTKGMYLITSQDGGKSWSPDRLIMASSTLSGPGHGLVLPNGRLLFASGFGGIYSDDDGTTWRWGYTFSEDDKATYNEGTIADLGSDRLLVCYKLQGFKRSHRCALSLDNGMTIGKFEAERYNTPLTVSVYANLFKPYDYNYVFYSMPTDQTDRRGIGIYTSKVTSDATPVYWIIGKPYLLKEANTRSAYSDMVESGKSIGTLYETGSTSTYEKIVYSETPIQTLINSIK